MTRKHTGPDCLVEGCSGEYDARGYCCVHYHKYMKYGDPLFTIHQSPGSGWVSKGYQFFTVDGEKSREHRAVAEKALGHPLPKGAVVHHIDEDRLNNKNDNLVICPSFGYHRQIHMRMDALKNTGHADWRKCPYCHKYDSPENMVKEAVRSVHSVCRNLLQKRMREGHNAVHISAGC